MNLNFLLRCIWHGLSQGVITVGTAMVAMDEAPATTWAWVTLIVGGILAMVKAIDGFQADPN